MVSTTLVVRTTHERHPRACVGSFAAALAATPLRHREARLQNRLRI